MKAVSFLQAFGIRQSINVCPRPGETGEKVIGLAALLPAKEIYAMHVTALLQKNMLELPGVWSDATSPPNPCWIVVCSSSAPRSDINSLIISGPVPLVRPTLHLCQIAEALRE